MNFYDRFGSGQRESNSGTVFTRRVGSVLPTVGLIWAAWLGGCAAPPKQDQARVKQEEMVARHDELKGKIDEFVDFFRSTVERAAMDVERKSPAKEHRRAAAVWRVHMVDQCRSIADDVDSREALIDVWTLCRAMLDFFTTGQGKAIFGENQEIAVTAAKSIYDGIERIARKYILPDAFERAKERVTAYALEHPIKKEFTGQPSERLSDDQEAQEALRRIVAVPLAPLTAIGGVGRTGESVGKLSDTADRFTDVVEDFPANARWQLQLLAMNLEEMPTVAETAGSIKQFSESTARFTQVMDEMPKKVRQEAEGLLEHVDKSQPELQTTLAQAQKTAEAIGKTSQDLKDTSSDVNQTVTSVKEASAALEKAANAVTITAKEVLKFIPTSMKDETGQIMGKEAREVGKDDGSKSEGSSKSAGSEAAEHDGLPEDAGGEETKRDTSFSFQAVTESAVALGNTMEKAHRLLADVQVFVDSDSIPKQASVLDTQFGQRVDLTRIEAQGLVDHVAKRCAQLLLFLFVLLVVYRMVSTRIRPAQAGAG